MFDVVFSGGDVGELILTYRPGNKGKEWSNAAEAAARGHLHIVKWLEAATDGVAADSCAADAAATGGQLETLNGYTSKAEGAQLVEYALQIITINGGPCCGC